MKRWVLSGGLLTTMIILSGCMRTNEAGEPTGTFSQLMYDYLVVPAEYTLDWLNSFFGNYGFAIIILTILVRVIILPFTLKQQRSMMEQQIKMSSVKPIIDDIQADMQEATDPAEKQALQQELMAVYKENDISMVGQLAGCLPMLFQMPIFIAVLHVFRHSEAIATTTFFGIPLGEPSMVLAAVTVVLYYLQSKMMTSASATSDNDSNAPGGGAMTLMMPIMMGMISFTSPAGLALYFMVSAIVGIAQQFYINKVFKPSIQADLDERYGDKIEATRKRQSTRAKQKANTQKQAPKRPQDIKVPPTKNRRRNQGKQNR